MALETVEVAGGMVTAAALVETAAEMERVAVVTVQVGGERAVVAEKATVDAAANGEDAAEQVVSEEPAQAREGRMVRFLSRSHS